MRVFCTKFILNSLPQVLEISLKAYLHHPQYCKKVEEVITGIYSRAVCLNAFSIPYSSIDNPHQQRKLSLNDLELIWNSQVGKHDTVVGYALRSLDFILLNLNACSLTATSRSF